MLSVDSNIKKVYDVYFDGTMANRMAVENLRQIPKINMV